VGGKGVLLWTGKKSKDFQSCLPILPAYLPLKFPNGQFPLKIPGPISQAKPKPMKKKKKIIIAPFSFNWITRWKCYSVELQWTIKTMSEYFQLYRGGQFTCNWHRKPEDPDKTTDLSQVTDKLYQIMLHTSPWSRFEFTTSAVIGTDCIGCCIYNYHTMTTTTAPL
jgi:hypothetical protein